MLFVIDKKNKQKGCFNHQKSDNDILYSKNISLSERINSFFEKYSIHLF